MIINCFLEDTINYCYKIEDNSSSYDRMLYLTIITRSCVYLLSGISKFQLVLIWIF